MTTLLVNISNEQEEKELLAFLDSHNYNYNTDSHFYDLTENQKAEVLRREADFASGKITSEPWSEVKKRFIR
jgi:hypothetical protein